MSEKRREQLQELPLELRAYINQQVSTLAPFCLPDSGVTVVVEKEIGEDENTEFLVTISLSGEGAEVYATGRADHIIDATKAATQTLVDHLQKVQRQMIIELEEKKKQKQKAKTIEDDDDEGGSSDEGGGQAVCH